MTVTIACGEQPRMVATQKCASGSGVTGAARLRRYAGTTGDTRRDTKKSTMLIGFRSAIFNLIHWTLAGNCRCAPQTPALVL